MNGRNRVYDSLKWYSAFLIFTTHFLKDYAPAALYGIWDELPSRIILYGVTGKFAVAIFGVISGYFAFRSGRDRANQSIADYAIKRYIYFFICGLFIDLVYTIYNGINDGFSAFAFVYALKEALFINSSIYETFWCMKDFLVASILCFVMGRAKSDLKANAIIAILLCISHPWVGICMLGTLIDDLLEYSDILKKPWCQAIMFISIFIFIKREESTITYVIQGILSVVLILLANTNAVVNKILDNKITAAGGQICMAIFLIHRIVYTILSDPLYSAFDMWNRNIATLVIWIIDSIVVMGMSIYVNKMLSYISNKLVGIVERK